MVAKRKAIGEKAAQPSLKAAADVLTAKSQQTSTRNRTTTTAAAKEAVSPPREAPRSPSRKRQRTKPKDFWIAGAVSVADDDNTRPVVAAPAGRKQTEKNKKGLTVAAQKNVLVEDQSEDELLNRAPVAKIQKTTTAQRKPKTAAAKIPESESEEEQPETELEAPKPKSKKASASKAKLKPAAATAPAKKKALEDASENEILTDVEKPVTNAPKKLAVRKSSKGRSTSRGRSASAAPSSTDDLVGTPETPAETPEETDDLENTPQIQDEVSHEMETEVRPAKNQRKTTAAVPGSQEMETEVRPVRNQRKNTAAVPEPSSEDEVTDRPPRNQRKTAAAAVPETRPLVAAAPPIRTRSLSRREERSVTSEEYRKIRDLYEELQKSYQTLYDVGVQEGITRFNEYKRTAEEKFQAYETWNTKLQEQVDTLSESAQTDAVAHKAVKKQLEETRKELKEAQKAIQRREKDDADGKSKKAGGDAVPVPVEDSAGMAAKTAVVNGEAELVKKLKAEVEMRKGREKELMGEVKSLKEKIPALIQTHEQTKSHLITTHAQQRKQDLATIHRLQQHDRYLVTVERMVRMYENLTGLTIQAVEEGKRLWSVDEEAFVLGEQREDDEEVEAVEVPVVVFRCRQKGRNAAIDYTLTIPDQPSTLPPSPKKAHPQPKAMVYDPVVRPSAPQQQLPDFLMQPLGFEQEACGFLFYKIMDCLNCEGDESGEEELEGESD